MLSRPRLRTRLQRPFWVAVGAVSLAIGAVGVVLPILPTTPFVILAGFAFARGAPKVARWIETHRIFGPILADWRAHGAIAPRYKRIAMGMMALAVLAAMLAGAPVHAIAIQMLCIAGAASFILTRPNGPDPIQQPSARSDSQILPLRRPPT